MVDRARRIKWTDKQVIARYKKLRSSNKAAKSLGIGQTTIFRVLLKHGIKATGLEYYREQARAFDPATDRKIAAAYKRGDWSADLASKYGVTIYAIKQALRRAGTPLRPNPAPVEKPGELAKVMRLYEQGYSQQKISLQIDRSMSFVTGLMRRNGVKYDKKRRESHGQWKGGRIQVGGYWKVLVDDDDPMESMGDNRGYVLEHRLVMARHVGRPLDTRETVHHINGDRGDNRLENLQLRAGRHGKGVCMQCLDCGSHNVGSVPIKDVH